MAINAFIGLSPDGLQRWFFGSAPPSAADGNAYVVGDFIWNRPATGTAISAGGPIGWTCVTAGTGATAVFVASGSSTPTSTAVVTAPATVTSVLGNDGGAVFRFTIPFGALPAGASPQQVSLFVPPTKSIIERVVIKHSTAFAGGALASMTVAVGIAASATLYSPAFDVFQAVAGNTLQIAVPEVIDNYTAPTAVVATFTSGGANPNAATAGSVDIYIWFVTSIV